MTSDAPDEIAPSTKGSPDGEWTARPDTESSAPPRACVVLASEPWVENTTVFPANRPDSLVVSLERQYYPRKHVPEAYIEVQSYTNGDFHISYVEDKHGETWLCRWDRHDSEDYTRDHFHAPPKARHDDGENWEYPTSLWTVISQVVAPWVYERMGAVWDEFDS